MTATSTNYNVNIKITPRALAVLGITVYVAARAGTKKALKRGAVTNNYTTNVTPPSMEIAKAVADGIRAFTNDVVVDPSSKIPNGSDTVVGTAEEKKPYERPRQPPYPPGPRAPQQRDSGPFES